MTVFIGNQVRTISPSIGKMSHEKFGSIRAILRIEKKCRNVFAVKAPFFGGMGPAFSIEVEVPLLILNFPISLSGSAPSLALGHKKLNSLRRVAN